MAEGVGAMAGWRGTMAGYGGGNRLETRMTAMGAVGGGRGSEGGSVAASGAFSRSRCKVGVGATDAPAASESQKYV